MTTPPRLALVCFEAGLDFLAGVGADGVVDDGADGGFVPVVDDGVDVGVGVVDDRVDLPMVSNNILIL